MVWRGRGFCATSSRGLIPCLVGCVAARLKSCPVTKRSRVPLRRSTADPSTPLKCASLRMTGFGVGEGNCATSSRGLIFIWVGVRGGPAEAVPCYKAFAGPLAKSNRRSFDSAGVRFAQDDRWFGWGGDFARLRRVDCLSIWWGGCGTTEVVPFQSMEELRFRRATAGPSTPVAAATALRSG